MIIMTVISAAAYTVRKIEIKKTAKSGNVHQGLTKRCNLIVKNMMKDCGFGNKFDWIYFRQKRKMLSPTQAYEVTQGELNMHVCWELVVRHGSDILLLWED